MVQTIVLPRCSTPKNEWFHVKTRILCAFANDTCDDAVTFYAAMICTARQFREPQYKLTNRTAEFPHSLVPSEATRMRCKGINRGGAACTPRRPLLLPLIKP